MARAEYQNRRRQPRRPSTALQHGRQFAHRGDFDHVGAVQSVAPLQVGGEFLDGGVASQALRQAARGASDAVDPLAHVDGDADGDGLLDEFEVADLTHSQQWYWKTGPVNVSSVSPRNSSTTPTTCTRSPSCTIAEG